MPEVKLFIDAKNCIEGVVQSLDAVAEAAV